jgi:hypothetical protein
MTIHSRGRVLSCTINSTRVYVAWEVTFHDPLCQAYEAGGSSYATPNIAFSSAASAASSCGNPSRNNGMLFVFVLALVIWHATAIKIWEAMVLVYRTSLRLYVHRPACKSRIPAVAARGQGPEHGFELTVYPTHVRELLFTSERKPCQHWQSKTLGPQDLA